MGPGFSFGEMALLNDRLRNASIQCTKKTKLAILSKEDFHLLLNAYQKDYAEKLEILRQLPSFRHWAKVSLQKFSRSLIAHEFKRGQYIFKAGDPANKVYIMKTGQAKIVQQFCFRVNDEKVHKLNRVKQQEQVRTKELQIVIKEAMFGFEDILNETQVRTTSCVALTDSSAFVVEAEEFNRVLQNQITKQTLERQNNVNKRWESDRIKSLRRTEMFKSERAGFSKVMTGRDSQATTRPPSNVKRYVNPQKKVDLPNIVMNLLTPKKRVSSVNSTSLFCTEVPTSSSFEGSLKKQSIVKRRLTFLT